MLIGVIMNKITSKLPLVLVIITSLLILSACSSVSLNMGATDYQVANQKGKLHEKYFKLPDEKTLLINKGDSISLHLQHGFIKDFSERLERFTTKITGSTVRGEIAILAKVYEQEDGSNLSFSQQSVKDNGRLVYYSEDVRSGGHPLNFSSMPIYGPIEYKGNSLVVQLIILELDIAESNQLKGMLTTLAKFGQQAFPPASPVLKVLDSVGSQLLSGEQDDIEFMYSFTLHPDSGHKGVAYPKVKVGNYVFLREEPSNFTGSPFPETDWDKLKVDPVTGRLQKCVALNEVIAAENVVIETAKLTAGSNLITPVVEQTWKSACEVRYSYEDFRDNTYLVMQINSGLPSVGLDVAQAFSTFESEINGEKNYDEFEAKLTSAVVDFKKYSEERYNKKERNKIFSTAQEILTSYQNREDDDLLAKQQDLAEFYDLVIKDPASKKPADLSVKQWRVLIVQLRGLAKTAFKISKESALAAADYTALEKLLN